MTLQAVIAGVPQQAELACRAWAEIASLRDAEGDYGGALEAVEQYKQTHRARSEADWRESERVIARYGEMVESITAADFERWQHADGSAHAPVALLTGFPRSGTTLLEKVLDAHPEIVSSEERDFLAQELFPSLQREYPRVTGLRDLLDQLPAQRREQARQRYLSVMEWLLGEPIGERLHLDKNPAYNLTIPVLLRLFPRARLLIALRDPRDVVLSCYMTYLPLNPVSVRFLTLKRTAERYAVDMRAWQKFRKMILSPWHEIRYEDVVADLESAVRQSLEKLGIPWHEGVLQYREHLREKRVTSPTYRDVALPVHSRSMGRWKNYQEFMAPVLETLAPFVQEYEYEL